MGYTVGKESRSDVFCGSPFERPCLRPQSVTINGSEAIVVRSGWWKGANNVNVDVLKPFGRQGVCPGQRSDMLGDFGTLALDASACPGAAVTLHCGPNVTVSHKACTSTNAQMAEVV